MNSTIYGIIQNAINSNAVTYNKHGVGWFGIHVSELPEGLTFDRLGLHDITFPNNDGCAQLRKTIKLVVITFNWY